MNFRWLTLLILLSVNLKGITQVKLDFLDAWILTLGKNEIGVSVPGELVMDLFNENIIPNPYHQNSESTILKLDEEKYEYHTSFLGEAYHSRSNTELVFEGIDTYAEIVLNGESIGSTNNMFRTWVFDLSDKMEIGRNDLIVRFTLPVNYHSENLRKAKYQLPSGNETVGKKVSCYTRKAAYQFGWDWAPRMVGCGIWRPVFTRSWNDARIENIHMETIRANTDSAYINYHIEIQSALKIKKNISILINGDEHEIKVEKGRNMYTFKKIILKPELWYPNGYGEAVMHLASVRLIYNENEIDSKAIHYGIRTVELIQEADSIGTPFYFKINGQEIFAKGANYVPMSSLPSTVKHLDYKLLIEKVKSANMNMLRVWGGGIYEDDLFYKFCDENGILVWQDFMFANSLYPSEKEFHANIIQGATDNVKRLRNHPCLVLWCGNNEIEVAWNNWGWQKQFEWSSEDSIEIWNNYIQLFHNEIPNVLQKECPTLPYVSTSPMSNWGTADNFNHSSMHYWGVWHGEDDFDDFQNNVGRFMVEYGFQSYPTYDQLMDFTAEKIDLGSKFLKQRQKSYIGDRWIIKEMIKRYGEVTDIKKWLLLSQHIQSLALKKAIQQHRINAPHCMGTLFWQLNNCWPGPSWSVINYEGNEKVAYSTIKKQFSSVIAMADTIGKDLVFWTVSDEPDEIEASLIINIEAKSKIEIIDKSIPILLKPLNPQINYRVPISFITEGLKPDDVVVSYSIKNRLSGEILFKDVFYFGLSPAEKAILKKM